MRLDQFLYSNNYAKSRNQAQEMIKSNLIKVNQKIINKANYNVNDNDCIEIVSEWKFVSRAGYKLEYAINEFKLDFNNKIVLDLGSSTGGFVDCALQHNASKVYALDVGSNQLDEKLKNNVKVINLENTNIKNIKELTFDKIDIITADLSFISLKHVFENINHLINENTIMIFLIKPQFELNQKQIKNNNYCVKNEKDRIKAINNVERYGLVYNTKLIKYIESPIKGAKFENIEYLGLFKRD